MNIEAVRTKIEEAWEDESRAVARANADAIDAAFELMESGAARAAEKVDGEWRSNDWVKKAILLNFALTDSSPMESGMFTYLDKLDVRRDFSGVRVVPPATVRRGAHLGSGVVLMPSYVNVGASVGGGSMVDTWATVGSCAQIGRNCHLSGGVGIGGVLEPLQATPVIIEDHVFIGARSEVAEGVIVEEGAVLSMGVFIGASTKVVDRETGEIHQGRVPAFSVVVPGSLPGRPLPDGSAGPNLACVVIVKRVDERTRAKTSVNDLLRD